jgi:lipopolysaccharide transport system permease protein
MSHLSGLAGHELDLSRGPRPVSMQRFNASPVESVASLWRHRSLVLALVRREVTGRYRGSVMGLAWSFFNPLVMLAIYTAVFSLVFKARWGAAEETKADFAIILFVGLIVHGIFAECINRAPNLMLENVNYVKKVVFPLEILPWVALGSALFHAVVSVVVLLVAQLALRGTLPWTAALFPLVLLPLAFTTVGIAWILTALGVYLRDIGQTTALFTTIMMFVSPVFFPVSSVPERFQVVMHLNPLTYIIEEGRKSLVFGVVPDFGSWLVALVAGLVVAFLGFAWFQKSRRGFADVL